MRQILLFLLFLCLAVTPDVRGETLEELSKRVKELEQQQAEMLLQQKEPRPQMSSFLNDNLTFGGFFEPGYTFIAGPDTDAQAATANILAFNLSADYQSNFRFSAQTLSVLGVGLQNPHNDPRVAVLSPTFPEKRQFATPAFATTLVQGYLEYRKSREFNVQVGLGYVPFGYAFQQRELILFYRRGGPQMVRNAGSIVSSLWEGVHIHGSFPAAKDRWGYNVYSFSAPEKINTLGAGGRTWWASATEAVVAGISAQTSKGENESYETIGGDIKFEQFPFIVRSEFFQALSKGTDPWSMYVEPAIYVFEEKVLLYVFADFLNNPKNETNNILSDPYQRWEYGGGVNWLPTSYTRFRLGLTYNDYIGNSNSIEGQQRDYWSLDLSAGVAF